MQNSSINPLVSIVIPVYNGEKYIEESLNSCLNQTYSNIEIIVVNDASTDSTLNILNKYHKNDKRIRVITVSKKENLGQVINEGIRASEGVYIARMDADDIMYQDRIEKQVAFLEANPKTILVGGQLDIIGEDGNITGSRNYSLDDKELRRNLFLFQPFAHPAVMIRKSSLEEIGLYPEDTKKVEDTKLMFLLSQVGEFANLPDTVLKYRVTFETESQAKMIEHFNKTNQARVWAIKKLGMKPSFREIILWNCQKIIVNILKFLPNKLFFSIFELGRNIIK